MIHTLLFAIAAFSPAQADSVLAKAEHAFHAYVFPHIGAKTIAMLKHNTPRYQKLPTEKAFVEAVNADLYAATHDEHVHIEFPVDTAMLAQTPLGEAELHHLEVAHNYGFREVRRLPGNVGYIDFGGFSNDADVGRTIAAAMQFLSGTDALIIDLRRNGGGSTRAAETFERYFFKHRQQITSIMWRDPDTGVVRTNRQYTDATVPGPLYLSKPVYLLTSGFTFSCAEQFAYDLHNLKRVTIVGETTGGGANPGVLVPVASDMVFFVPEGRAYSPVTHANWESTGIAPDVAAPAKDALVRAYGLALRVVQKTDKLSGIQREVKAALDNPQSALRAGL